MIYRKLYYNLKPVIPRHLQIFLRRIWVKRKRKLYSHIWPIDPNAGNPPPNWPGWPEGKQFCLVLSHDVDTQAGHDKALKLLALEKRMGFRSSFNFVPEKYTVSEKVRQEIAANGFEVCVHGLNHDGRLFSSRKIFDERAVRINEYLKAWNAEGFTSPSMHHNLDWMHALDITHDTSTFDTDPFEPQPDAVETVFPLWIRNHQASRGYVELPYTLPQDHTLFIMLQERTNAIWKQKLDWIAKKGGMVLLNSHPDYMQFADEKPKLETYPVSLYQDFLEYIRQTYAGEYWHVLPREAAKFCEKHFSDEKNKKNLD